MTNGNIVHESIFVIEKMASLSSTEGVNQETKDIANKHMQDLLNGPVAVHIKELKALSAGIVTVL